MSLGPGSRLGPYEIAAQIGAGGMGEVYRATDTNLGRQVAIKILPDTVAHDAERLARFEREAKLLAALNHPNIAQIYGFERTDTIRALVMELVEGPTLADRVAQAPIPVAEVLPIARQIADALETAHEQGIVHRDLKPANIKLRADGTVKVLDFGLAKAMEPALSGVSASLANSPTLTSPAIMTGAGIVLGTSAYIAPEPARGRAVDRRADIWAFGVVLYEMLVGRQMFQGEDVTEILASVVKEQPDLSAAPPQVRRVLEACLKKDRRQRLQAIGDWRLMLDDVASTNVPVAAVPKAKRVPWLVAGAAAALLAGLAVVHFREVAPEERVLKVSVPLPAGSPGWIELSPDGRRLLVTVIQDGKSRTYLRKLDSEDWEPLTAAE